MSVLSGVYGLARKTPLDSATEQALVAKCRQNDGEAFGRIVDAYQNRVLGFVLRMVRHEEEALDVTQEVFVRAFQSLHRFDGRASLRTWLFRIAYNLCVDRSRKRERTPLQTTLDATGDGEDGFETPDQRWNPEVVAMGDELVAVAERAVETMSEKLRVVLLLHDKEGLGYEEIAQMVDIPVGTVKSRLFLARAHMQKWVGAYLDPSTEVPNHG